MTVCERNPAIDIYSDDIEYYWNIFHAYRLSPQSEKIVHKSERSRTT